MAKRTTSGLKAATSRGVSRQKIASRGGAGSGGDRVRFQDKDKNNVSAPVQFYVTPENFLEYEIHQYMENNRWQTVPCVGDGCPKCDDENETVSKTKYRFVAPVWHFTEKRSMVLEGPKALIEKIMYRYDRPKGAKEGKKITKEVKDAAFLKSTYECIQYPTEPVSYGTDKGDYKAITLNASDAKDLDAYVDGQLKYHYGDELPTASSLDADDSAVDDGATTWTKKDLKKKSPEALAKIAKDEGVGKKVIKEAGDDPKALIALILGSTDK